MNKLRCIVAGITFLLLGPPIRAEISTVFLATTSQTNGSQRPTTNRLPQRSKKPQRLALMW